MLLCALPSQPPPTSPERRHGVVGSGFQAVGAQERGCDWLMHHLGWLLHDLPQHCLATTLCGHNTQGHRAGGSGLPGQAGIQADVHMCTRSPTDDTHQVHPIYQTQTLCPLLRHAMLTHASTMDRAAAFSSARTALARCHTRTCLTPAECIHRCETEKMKRQT